MRQLIVSTFPDSQGITVLENREYKYLVQVLRKTEGDTIEARLPDGRLCHMVISCIDRREKRVSLIEAETHDPNRKDSYVSDGEATLAGVSMPPISEKSPDFPTIVLFQWVLKGPKMDQVIRQATETGVSIIVPVAGDRCLLKDADAVGEEKALRWERIVREARQQSGSPVLTRIMKTVSVLEIPDLWRLLSEGNKSISLVLTEAPLARKSLHEYLVNGAEISALAIGPEGGMTVKELDILESTGFVCVHFRTNILRAETAALYGIAALQSALTESENWQLKE